MVGLSMQCFGSGSWKFALLYLFGPPPSNQQLQAGSNPDGSAAATWDIMSVSRDVLQGLAAKWEEDRAIRRNARECGRLVHWPSPETVGVASMTHVCTSNSSEACMAKLGLFRTVDLGWLRKALVLNIPVLRVLANKWVYEYDFPRTRLVKTPPLKAIIKEVSWRPYNCNDPCHVRRCSICPTCRHLRSKSFGGRSVLRTASSPRRLPCMQSHGDSAS